MSYEIPSHQPDLLLDYYERHFLRTLGNYACSNYGFVEPDSDTERVLKLYEPSAENVAITDSFVRPPDATVTDQLGLLASRARIWGDVASREIAAREIFSIADKRGSDSEVSDETIIATLVVAGRPDIAHIKLKAYQDRLGESYRNLLFGVGKGYCRIAKSKRDLHGVPDIIEELKIDDPKSKKIVTNRWGLFKTTQTHIDATKKRLHKDLQAHLNGAHYRIEHPEFFEYNTVRANEDPYPYATAYHEGGVSAAFGLHEYNNRNSRDKSASWAYRSIVADLAKSGELSLAHELANEGLTRVAQEYEDGVVPAATYYDIIRHVIDGYAGAHDLERAHQITTAIPDYEERDVRVSARRMIAKEYVHGYAAELQPGDTMPDHHLETAIAYVKQYVPHEGEREATFGWMMDVLAPYGQVDAIKRIAAHLPPLHSTPYQHGRWPLFAAHIANKDYAACTEYLDYWPSKHLTADALTSVIQEKQRRKALA